MPAPVIIVDPDPSWPEHFARYRAELLTAAGPFLEHVEHVGSTSVPGLAAKPIIDILVGVAAPSLIDVDAEETVVPGDGKDVQPAGPADHVAMVQAILGLGYRYRGENGIPGRLLFGHRQNIRPGCHIHLVRTGSAFWVEHLAFRDHLRTHPDRAAAYADLKRDLASRFRDQRQAYTAAKTEFIVGCVREALR